MDLTLQLKDFLISMFDIRIGGLVLGITQLVKFYMPDNIEGKWIPGIAALVAVVSAIFLHVELVKALMTGLIVSGTFGSVKEIMASAGTNTAAPK